MLIMLSKSPSLLLLSPFLLGPKMIIREVGKEVDLGIVRSALFMDTNQESSSLTVKTTLAEG